MAIIIQVVLAAPWPGSHCGGAKGNPNLTEGFTVVKCYNRPKLSGHKEAQT
jgi:hypothetical protein